MIVEITINGELKQLVFDHRAYEKYTLMTGADIGSLKEITAEYSQLDMVRDYIVCGLFGYYRKNGLIWDENLCAEIDKAMGDVTMLDQLKVIQEFTRCCLRITNEMAIALKAIGGNAEKKK